MAVTDLIQAIVDAIGGSIVEIAQKLGEGISAIVTNLVYVTTGTGADAVTTLSPFAILALVLMGLSLGFSLFRWGLNFFTSLGRRNR